MPSEKSARVTSRKTQYNRGVKSAANSAVARARRTMAMGNREESLAAVARAASALDRAAKRGIIHHNNASRRKSRLARELHALN